jgi:glucosamine--fructose-6-phosphate aminotransferase (isomerizing)
MANVAEVKSRGATVVVVAHDSDEAARALGDYVLYVPSTELFFSIVDMVVLQQFAYHMARQRGLNVDRPRNLAKTVTVE